MSTSSQEDPVVQQPTTQETRRAAFVTALRDVAGWLEATPDAPTPYLPISGYKFDVPMSTNAAVQQAGAAFGLDVTVDRDGNASCDMKFDGLNWHMYGYADFTEYSETLDERHSRQWAERKGLEIVAPLVSDDTIRQADNLLALNIADREAAEGQGGTS